MSHLESRCSNVWYKFLYVLDLFCAFDFQMYLQCFRCLTNGHLLFPYGSLSTKLHAHWQYNTYIAQTARIDFIPF